MLVQLAARRTGFHPVSRTVFRPPPNVESALVAFRRVELPDRFADVRRVVEAAFAHRRKTLANSLALAGVATREQAVAALATIGLDCVRARGGARTARVRGARGGAAVNRAPAPAKINLALVVGPPRARRQARGRHRAATHRPRRPDRDRAGRHAQGRRVRRTRSSAPLFAPSRCVPEWSRPGRPASGSRFPWRRAWAAAARTPPPPSGWPTTRWARRSHHPSSHSWPPRVGADVPFFLRHGPQLGSGDGSTLVAAAAAAGLLGGARAACRRRRSRRPRSVYESVRRAARCRRVRRAPGKPPRRARARAPRARPRRPPAERPRRPRRSLSISSSTEPSGPTSAAPARPSTASSTIAAMPRLQLAPSAPPAAPG